MDSVYDLIRSRRSVRTYDSRPVSDGDLARLEDFFQSVSTPYDIPVTFRLLDAKEHGLTSPVVSGAALYAAGKVDRVPHAEEAFGFAAEELSLTAWEMGLGTVWMAATMNRPAFEKALALAPEEMMPCVTPVGYPAKKMSLRETVMRKGVGADNRKPFEELFFQGDFNTPLTPQTAGKLTRPLEAVRRAPSAVNKQPWRVVVAENAVHFYLRHSGNMTKPATGDIQKVDLGIALCHFARGLQAEDIPAVFTLSDPGIPAGEGTEYIASFML